MTKGGGGGLSVVIRHAGLFTKCRTLASGWCVLSVMVIAGMTTLHCSRLQDHCSAGRATDAEDL